MVAFALAGALPAPLAAQQWLGQATLGVAVKSSKGAPLAKAVVTIAYRDVGFGDGPPPRRTENDGEVNYGGIAAGTWSLKIDHPDHLSYLATLIVRQGKKPEIVAEFLEATGTGRLTMRVKFLKGITDNRGVAIAESPEKSPPQPSAGTPTTTEVTPASTANAPTNGEMVEPSPATRPDVTTIDSTATAPPADEAPSAEPSPDREPAGDDSLSIPASAPAPTPTPPSAESAPPPAPSETADVPAPPAPTRSAGEAEAHATTARPDTAVPAPSESEDAGVAAPQTPQSVLPEDQAPAVPVVTAAPGDTTMAPTPELVPRPAPTSDLPPATAEEVPSEQVPEPPTAGSAAATPTAEAPGSPREGVASLRDDTRQESPPTPPAAETPLTAPSPPTPTPAQVSDADSTPSTDTPVLEDPSGVEQRSPPSPAPLPIEPEHASLRSSRDRSCPECRPGEWSLSAGAVVASSSEDSCSTVSASDLSHQMKAVVAAHASRLSEYFGPFPASGKQLPPELDGLIAGSCRLVAVVLPQRSRYSGFRFQAEDDSGGGDCTGDRECPVGAARWLADPEVVSDQGVSIVYSVFRNDSATSRRAATLTAFFVPSPKWAAEHRPQ